MSWLVHHGNNRDWLATLPPDSHDVCVSDPPYADETHDGARTKTVDQSLLADSFSSITFANLRDTLGLIGTVTRRWIVITCDWRHAAKLSETPPAGVRFVRFGVWVKPNGAPQFTGDRPGPGWEAVAWMHRDGVPLKWSGGGRSSVFTEPKVSGEHPTTKPLPLLRQFVALTSDGGPVLDPWCGSGGVGVAAVERGLAFSGCDIDAKWVALARARIDAAAGQGTLFATLARAKQQEIDL
jgi:site-specific DNA-methyltransferase (adenine-specific)